MRTIALGAKDMSLSELEKIAGYEPVIVTRFDKPVFAMIPVNAADIETWQLGDNPRFLELMERAWERAKTEGVMTLAEARERLLGK